MKKHCDKNIQEIIQGIQGYHIEEDLSSIHNSGSNARGLYGKYEKKVGEDAPSSVHEMVNLLKFWQYLKKVPESSTFVIVNVKEKLFIATFR